MGGTERALQFQNGSRSLKKIGICVSQWNDILRYTLCYEIIMEQYI